MPLLELESDYSLHYELIAGPPARPCLVFLHEGLGSVGQWRDFPQRLCAATGCPGLVYDRLGHGRSSPLRSAADDPLHARVRPVTNCPGS